MYVLRFRLLFFFLAFHYIIFSFVRSILLWDPEKYNVRFTHLVYLLPANNCIFSVNYQGVNTMKFYRPLN